MEHGAFQKEQIDVVDWVFHEIVEELTLSSMRAKIAAVEHPLAFSFDKKGVGVHGGVVDEKGGDGEVADGNRLPWLDVVEAKRVSVSA